MNTDLTTLTTFRDIAWRRRDARSDWHECDDAPLLLADARKLWDQGLITMANRFTERRVFVVVKHREQVERFR